MIRFPNPKSNPISLRDSFRDGVYAAFVSSGFPEQGLDHDALADIAVTHGLVTSEGQIGTKALILSRRADRSRDPIFNQMKMLTELYRLLGWLMPIPGVRNRFLVTPLGRQAAAFTGAGFDSISQSDHTLLERDFWERCLLNVCFPHPHTADRSALSQRTFLLFLTMAAQVGGLMTRDELIMTVLQVSDDRDTTEVSRYVQDIQTWRAAGGATRYQSARTNLARSWATMGNYTRFPIGIVEGVGWFDKVSLVDLSSNEQVQYKNELGEASARRTMVLRLTDRGRDKLASARTLADVRWKDLLGDRPDDLAVFAILVEACRQGRKISAKTAEALSAGETILRQVGIDVAVAAGTLAPLPVLFEPFQQLPSDVLLKAISLLQSE